MNYFTFVAPVPGHWGRWSSWSSCCVTCGPGHRFRSRLCDDPPPKYGGKKCLGTRVEAESCWKKTVKTKTTVAKNIYWKIDGFFYVHSNSQSSTFYKNNSFGYCLSDCLHSFKFLINLFFTRRTTNDLLTFTWNYKQSIPLSPKYYKHYGQSTALKPRDRGKFS